MVAARPSPVLGRLAVGMLVAMATTAVVALDVTQAQPAALCVENLQIMTDHDNAIVNLTWDPVTGAANYLVERQLEGGGFESVATVPAPQTFYEEMAPDGILDYRVAIDGPPDDTCPFVSTHIGGMQPGPIDPVCVDGVSAVPKKDGVFLDWEPVPGATSYEVLRAQGSDPLTPLATVGLPGVTEFLDTTAEEGMTYRYVVSAEGLPPLGAECEEVVATAIPFFPNTWIGVAVVIVPVAMYSWWQRRH